MGNFLITWKCVSLAACCSKGYNLPFPWILLTPGPSVCNSPLFCLQDQAHGLTEDPSSGSHYVLSLGQYLCPPGLAGAVPGESRRRPPPSSSGNSVAPSTGWQHPCWGRGLFVGASPRSHSSTRLCCDWHLHLRAPATHPMFLGELPGDLRNWLSVGVPPPRCL